MSRRVFALALSAVAATACRTAPVAPSTPPQIVERFAVGAIPRYCAPGIGENPLCCVEFSASGVIAIERADDGTARPRIVREGRFSGTCNGHPFWDEFEGVSVRATRIDVVARTGAWKPFELEAAHPELTTSLLAIPLDGAGKPLSVGRGGLTEAGSARWTMRPGCERVIQVSGFMNDKPGRGFTWPADEIKIGGRHRGTCTLNVDYLGAHAEAMLTVR